MAIDLSGIGDKRLSDEDFAKEFTERVLTFFIMDLQLTQDQYDWAYSRLYHLFRPQQEEPSSREITDE